MYWSEHSSPLIPSLTLLPTGWDRSTISLHFPGWFNLGMTPKTLKWISGTSDHSKGPNSTPCFLSTSKYSLITVGFPPLYSCSSLLTLIHVPLFHSRSGSPPGCRSAGKQHIAYISGCWASMWSHSNISSEAILGKKQTASDIQVPHMMCNSLRVSLDEQTWRS